MTNSIPLISLGFTEDKVPAGTHICQIFTDDEERNQSLLQYLLYGLQSGERVACFSEKIDETAMEDFLNQNDLSFAESCRNGAISLSGTRDVYFKDDRFDPERMFELLADFLPGVNLVGVYGGACHW